LRAQYR